MAFPARPRARGSSPLTRGKRPLLFGAWGLAGLIPAHAGKTSRRLSLCQLEAAHPRSRGENGLCCSVRGAWQGSSPLTRGKRTYSTVSPSLLGLIPAHAGKTLRAYREPRGYRAHPRSRGENPIPSIVRDTYGGSSPLTRGKLLFRFWSVALMGLIPAHAGKTTTRDVAQVTQTAHPRSRGENTEGPLPIR